MWIRKETGGNSNTWRGTEYTWPVEDPVCEVPDDLGRALLAIPGGGCSEAEPPQAPEADGGEEEAAAVKPARKPAARKPSPSP